MQVKRSTTPTFQPVINSQSKQIVKERFKSDSAFLDRMERYLLRKQDNQTRDTIYALAQDKNFTYKPQLNKASERLKGLVKSIVKITIFIFKYYYFTLYV